MAAAAGAHTQVKRLCLGATSACPAGDSELRQLDSSVKRNTALIKRLRQISEDTREALLQDIARTNQSKYVTEAVAAVADASLKSKDVAAAVQVCASNSSRVKTMKNAI